MKAIVQLLTCCSLYGLSLLCMAQTTSPGTDLILIRTSAKSPTEVVDAIKSHSEAKKWVYMGANSVKPKQGEVTMVKVCIPQVGGIMWPVGLHLSALLPCGNIGVYQNQGKTEISMLHPRYMQILYPHPEVERAVGVATPLLLDMLDTIAK
jgi:hypothetical protein